MAKLRSLIMPGSRGNRLVLDLGDRLEQNRVKSYKFEVRTEKFIELVAAVGYGKVLPDAVYIFRPEEGEVNKDVMAEIERAQRAANPSSEWNLLKLHTNQAAITFLFYENFDNDPHPALVEATKINLSTGTVIQTQYQGRANPPILHRKETFLPLTHPRHDELAALTKQEELAGLYTQPTRIGNRQFWHSLLRQKRLEHDGHTLVNSTLQATPRACHELGMR